MVRDLLGALAGEEVAREGDKEAGRRQDAEAEGAGGAEVTLLRLGGGGGGGGTAAGAERESGTDAARRGAFAFLNLAGIFSANHFVRGSTVSLETLRVEVSWKSSSFSGVVTGIGRTPDLCHAGSADGVCSGKHLSMASW